jgi:hypothetical protein
MAKKVINNLNANLPPLVVLGSFLSEKKKDFVTTKLNEFGLVRKEYFDRKLGHQKKDFKLSTKYVNCAITTLIRYRKTNVVLLIARILF